MPYSQLKLTIFDNISQGIRLSLASFTKVWYLIFFAIILSFLLNIAFTFMTAKNFDLKVRITTSSTQLNYMINHSDEFLKAVREGRTLQSSSKKSSLKIERPGKPKPKEATTPNWKKKLLKFLKELINSVLPFYISIVTMYRIHEVGAGHVSSLGYALVTGLKRFFKVGAATFLLFVVALTEIVAGIYFLGASWITALILSVVVFVSILSLHLTVPLIITEKRGVFNAFKTSAKLTFGNWIRTGFIYLIGNIFMFMIFLIIFILAVEQLDTLSNLLHIPSIILLFLIGIVSYMLYTIYLQAIVLTVLNDLKIRKLKPRTHS